MASKYVHRQSDASANAFPNRSIAAGLMVDSDDNKLKCNPDGTVVEVLDNAHNFTVAGAISFTGATAGVRRAVVISAAATLTLTAAQSGAVVIDTLGSGTSTFTLPAATTAGLAYTFVCGDAAGEIIVAVGTGDDIVGKIHGAENATGIDTTATTGVLKNTAATNVLGDFTTLVADGVSRWYMVSVAGVWAAA